MITSYYIEIQGIKVFVETNNGPKENGTVVCFGSAGRESRQYHGVMEYLEDKFEVISFDMPGHGKTWPFPGNIVISEAHKYCNFAIDVVKALNIINPIYMGCALGGNVVFYLAQHQNVRAVVSMAGLDYSPHVDPSVADTINHPYCSVQHSHRDFTDSLIGSVTTPEDREFILWGVSTEIGVVKAADYAGVYNGFDVRQGMDKITCPVLILRGDEDWTSHDENIEHLMNRLVNASKVDYRVMPGMAHYNPQESPKMVCDALISFLEVAEKEI